MTRRLSLVLPILTLIYVAGSAAAQASSIVDAIPAASASGRIVQVVALLSVLSVAPSLLVMMTSFTRFVVALSFLRSGIGLQSTPGNMVLVSLALFLTLFVMSSTFEKAWNDGVQPLVEEKISEKDAIARIVEPFREFMTANVREADLRRLRSLRREAPGEQVVAPPSLTVLIPAFMMSELRRGFEIGFLIALPFLVIDLIVATITMSMGMMMLPPSVIGLPIKVLFFVLIDGWALLIGGLVRSYV